MVPATGSGTGTVLPDVDGTHGAACVLVWSAPDPCGQPLDRLHRAESTPVPAHQPPPRPADALPLSSKFPGIVVYEIREMRPDDRPTVTSLWTARVRWAENKRIGLIRYCPLTEAETAAAVPFVLTCDGAVVATATIVDPTPQDGWTDREAAQRAVGLVRIDTDPALAADRLSWVITSWASDRAARTGHAWVRMRVAPSQLALHLSERLAWDPVRTVRTADGGTAHLLQHEAREVPGIRALVQDAPAMSGVAGTPSPVRNT